MPHFENIKYITQIALCWCRQCQHEAMIIKGIENKIPRGWNLEGQTMNINKKLANLAIGIFAAAVLLVSSNAMAAENDDWFYTNETSAQIFDLNSVIVQGELYLWNRVSDIFDVLECGIGFGGNIGVDLQVTKYAQLGAMYKYGKGVEFPHFIPPFWMFHYFQQKRIFRVHNGKYAAVAFGPWRKQNVLEEERHAVTFTSDTWDIRVEAAAIAHLYVDVKLEEVADFLVGFVGYDIKSDDQKIEDSLERRRPADQFGRGVCNILFGVLEVPLNILRITDEEGDFAGLSKGTALGVWRFIIRELVGVVELVSFPFGWDPIILPEYTWQKTTGIVWQVNRPSFQRYF